MRKRLLPVMAFLSAELAGQDVFEVVDGTPRTQAHLAYNQRQVLPISSPLEIGT